MAFLMYCGGYDISQQKHVYTTNGFTNLYEKEASKARYSGSLIKIGSHKFKNINYILKQLIFK